MKVPRDLLRRVKHLEDVLGADDKYTDVAELLDMSPEDRFAWLEGIYTHDQNMARRKLLTERHTQETFLAPMEALGISHGDRFDNRAEVDQVLQRYQDASPEEQARMTKGRSHLIKEVRPLPF